MRKHAVPAVLAAVVLSGLATPATASAGAGGAEPPARDGSFRERVQRHRPTGRLQVRFKDGVGATRRDAALAGVTGRGLSVRVDRRIPSLNAALVSVSNARAVQALLRDHPDVAYVEAESRYQALQATPDQASPELKEIGADVVHAPPAGTANTGAGTQIAILDSPVNAANPDLDNTGKVIFSDNYSTNVPGEDDVACEASTCPHGTAVAIAAAAQRNDGNLVGVAPDAAIRSYNVFRRFFIPTPFGQYEYVSASSADIADAIGELATHAEANPSIVAMNMSLGGPFDNQLVRDAISHLRTVAPQVTVVVAAGNDGGERANFPAGDPHVLSVGATGQVTGDDCSIAAAPTAPWTVASFSNRGDVDVVAPGHCVSLWYPDMNEETGAVVPGSTKITKISGTSFAAPMVAGVAALLASSATPLTGDAARAAIIAGAAPAPAAPNIAYGAGYTKAPSSLALGAGTTPFTAIALERGGQVASTVGKRKYEVLRVDPTKATTPAAPVPTATAGYGTASGGSTTSVAGLARRYGTFTVPATTKTGAFRLTATGGTAAAGDTAVVPMKMLDASNSYEGLPTASGEPGSAPLKFGSRSTYIRSFKVPSTGAYATWRFSYGESTVDPEGYRGAQLYLWEPTTPGGVADAAMEPIYGSRPAVGERSGADEFQMGGPDDWGCTYVSGPPTDPNSYAPCRLGRFLIGYVAFDSTADSSSTSRYALTTRWSTAPSATVTAPAVASSSSITGPFTVSWGGTRAVKWDVQYAVESRSGTSWVVGPWTTWKTGTTAKSAAFGSGGSPVKVTPGRTYRFRVRAWDSLGNPTVYVSKATAAPLDDRSGSIAYSGFSNAIGVTDRWQKTAKRATARGSRASLSGPSSLFTVVGDKCKTCGKFDVYLDGRYKATVDTYYSGSTAVRRTLWTATTRAKRITIIVAGTKYRPKVVLDGIGMVR